MKVLVYGSFFARLRGLIGSMALPAHQAVLLRPCSSVHTCFMRFAIDVYFLDAQNVVVKRVLGLAPWRFAWGKGATSALETAAGAMPVSACPVGTQLKFSNKENTV